MMRVRSKVEHARLASWVEHMKIVYQHAIDEHAASGRMDGGDIANVRNHLQCLAMIQTLLSEHHEMAQGKSFDAGAMTMSLKTEAVLIKPNGTVIPIRKEPTNG